VVNPSAGQRLLVDVLLDVGVDRLGLRVVDMLEHHVPGVVFGLHGAEDGGFRRAAALRFGVAFPADVGFVDLDDAEQAPGVGASDQSEALLEVPGGFLVDLEVASQLVA
jgi:hypothetical protein